ncbi:MAG: hypothetical protein ACO3NL_11675, partial [Phycisphaerales bacterium]
MRPQQDPRSPASVLESEKKRRLRERAKAIRRSFEAVHPERDGARAEGRRPESRDHGAAEAEVETSRPTSR